MPTISTDFFPATEGQDLGRQNQAWDLYVRNLTVVPGGSVNGTIFPTGNGNATALQGRNLSSTAPTTNQAIVWNGTLWLPGRADSLALQGRPVSSGAPSVNQALIWDGSQWAPANQAGGGGGGATLGFVTVGFSATPTFTPSPIGSCSFKLTLTADVTSSTFDSTSLTAGDLFTFIIAQDGTGGWLFTWPTNAHGTTSVGTDPSQTTVQDFVFDGTNLIPRSVGVTYP